jgi:hypothetical protein
MSFCPECRAEFRKGFDHCPTCDVDLVAADELPEMLTDEEVIASMAAEDVTPITRGSIEDCRETQRRLLEARVPAAIHEAQDVVGEAGHFRILQVVVRKEDVERSVEVLQLDWVEDAQREGLMEEMRRSDDDSKSSGEGDGEGDGEGEGEGEGDGDGDGEEEPEPACPACGCTKPLKKGKCRDCGLHLG